MKVLKWLILGALITGAYSSQAHACSMMPVDLDKQTEVLKRMVLPSLNLKVENVVSIEASDVKGGYIWSDPMCPEGVKAEATFTVSYDDVTDPLTKGCTAIVKVLRKVPTYLSKIPVENMFKTEILQEGICLE